MSSFEELSLSTEDFAGVVRLFPLPNLVLFPHVMQPLHVFELRYRRLLEDALATDRLIAMAVLEPGWERDYEGRPQLCPTACLGRVTTFHRLEDGTYNLLVLGLQRTRLIRELEPSKLYREAEAVLCEDCCPGGAAPQARALRRRLREAFVRALPLLPDAQEQIDQLLATDIPLSVLTDVISFMLDVGCGEKASLLCELDVCRRAESLLRHLDAMAKGNGQCAMRDFPPRFSLN
jgi:Lon protease-like protein